jgi:hypothetical protein
MLVCQPPLLGRTRGGGTGLVEVSWGIWRTRHTRTYGAGGGRGGGAAG